MANEEKILAALNELQNEMNALRSDISQIKTNTSLDIFNRSSKDLKIRPFNFFNNASPSRVAKFLEDESAKTVALVLANLEIDFAAIILTELPPDSQPEVVKEIAQLGITSPEVIKEVEKKFIEKLSKPTEPQYLISEGNISAVVEILNRVNRTTEKFIIKSLQENSPEIGEEIRKLMFVFEDIVTLDDRSLQFVLREVYDRDLVIAMKAVPQEVADKIYKNVSRRKAAELREEFDAMGKVNIRDVEAAQLKIVNVIRRLEATRSIINSR